MKISVVVFALIIAAVAPANAGGLQFRDFEVRGDQNVWTYSVTSSKTSRKLTVVLTIPRSAYVKPVFQNKKNPVRRQEKAPATTT